VTRTFHDAVCVQGSGRLHTGETISFSRRNCACAALCPRTKQHICFDLLDPRQFPYGRGAAGTAITPLRSVAVDSDVIPLGKVLYMPAYQGLRDATGRPHDGCFIAEDRGLKVRGKHVDIFTGSPRVTDVWNAAVPSNRGVRVMIGASRCAYLRQR
jgi:membrane-bound lytic murein transglycosylase